MEAYLSGRNVFVSAPTGAGKSSTSEQARIFQTMVLLSSGNFGTKCLSKVNLHHWILESSMFNNVC